MKRINIIVACCWECPYLEEDEQGRFRGCQLTGTHINYEQDEVIQPDCPLEQVGSEEAKVEESRRLAERYRVAKELGITL